MAKPLTTTPPTTPNFNAGAPQGSAGSAEFIRARYARNLFQAMTAADLTQAELARKLKTGRDSINGYIRARVLPNKQTQEKIAKVLGKTAEELNPSVNEQSHQEVLPAVELRQSVISPTKAWLRINKEVSFVTAAKIIALIQEDDGG